MRIRLMKFSEWLLESKALPNLMHKKKIASVAHADIDRWLKSVDGLAKDLATLKNAKEKAKDKITQIGQNKSEKPEEIEKLEKPEKPEQPEKVDVKPSDQKNIVNQEKIKPPRKVRPPNSEEGIDVKRIRQRPEDE